MDKELIITAEDTGSGKPLQIAISGSRLELLGFARGKKVAISEEYGKLTIMLLTVEESGKPVAEQKQTAEPSALKEQDTVEVVEVVQLEAVKVIAPEAVPAAHQEAVPEGKPAPSLFEHLVALRKQISSEVKLPPYIIFHDTTLKDMCKLMPTDLQAMKGVSGVGEAKLKNYGSRFVEVIREYIGKHGVKE